MERKRAILIAISATAALLAVTCVTASPWTQNTPLYTYRMEQASSRMNFLPAPMNNLTYTTEKGYILNCEVTECYNGVEPLNTVPVISCEGHTCYITCDRTCTNTCDKTCGGNTCDTCITC